MRILALAAVAAMALTANSAAAHEGWVLQIHGGAGTISRDKMTPQDEAEVRGALDAALKAGAAILDRGGSALDAVEAAVRILEDAPQFNAGRGAVLTDKGTVELDASIMEGSTRRAGAVAGITRAKNPITVARAVMEKTKHVMLAGPGADSFLETIGAEQADHEYFITERRKQELEQRELKKHGTVGAVARDSSGNLAAATSTGGTSAKLPGRVGDSPIIGAGTYADNRACAVSATGAGEFYIREGVAHEICARIRFLGEDAQTAADKVQAETLALGGDGGVIVIDNHGRAAWSFNTEGMYRGRVAAGSTAVIGIYGDE